MDMGYNMPTRPGRKPAFRISRRTAAAFAVLLATGARNLLLAGVITALLPVFALAAPSAPTTAGYRATYERELGRIRTNNVPVMTANSDYAKTLDALQGDFKKLGDFDNTMAVIAERKRFEATKMVPDKPPADLPPVICRAQADHRTSLLRAETERKKQIAKLNAAYAKALKELIKSYVIAGKIAEAEAANMEMRRAEAEYHLTEETLKAAGVAGDKPETPFAAPDHGITSATAGSTGEKQGLIAWYNFDDGTANDSSGNGNHGIVHGAKPASDRGRRPNRAMSFDGKASWIEVPSSRLYDALTEIGIALWVCPVNDHRRERTVHFLISKQPSGWLSQQSGPAPSSHGGLFDLYLDVKDGLVKLVFSSQVSPGMCTEGNTSRMKPLPLGQWHHLAITAATAENRLRIFVDGKKVDDVVCSDQIRVGHILSQPNNEPIRIGKRKDADFDPGRNAFFCGSMDDIRIYSRLLSEREVKDIYDARK